jgi:hypothetical protein
MCAGTIAFMTVRCSGSFLLPVSGVQRFVLFLPGGVQVLAIAATASGRVLWSAGTTSLLLWEAHTGRQWVMRCEWFWSLP